MLVVPAAAAETNITLLIEAAEHAAASLTTLQPIILYNTWSGYERIPTDHNKSKIAAAICGSLK
jgi:hypothetical protein